MRPSVRPALTMMVLPVAGWLLVAVTGCRDADDQARRDLQRTDFPFSLADFQRAAASGETAAVTRFLDAGMNPDAPDARGMTALLEAAAAGHGHIVKLLLERGASASLAAADGTTPLLAACRSQDPEMVRRLLSAGADIRVRDPSGRSPLEVAAQQGRAEIAAVLAGKSGPDHGPALALAAAAGFTGVVDVLLNAGANPDIPLTGGRTPLMIAAAHGQDAVAKLLCHRGANPALRDTEGESAVAAARRYHHEDLAAWMENWPGRNDTATTTAGPSSAPASLSLPGPDAPPQRLSGLRRPDISLTGLAELPATLTMSGYRQKQYPFILKDVAREHVSATLEMRDTGKTLTVRAGSPVPGTGLTVETLRRRYLYANGHDGDLVNASHITLVRDRDRHPFRLPVNETLYSTDSVAELRLASGERFEAEPGDEFRLGTALLRIEDIRADGVTVVNRLTRESIVLPRARP